MTRSSSGSDHTAHDEIEDAHRHVRGLVQRVLEAHEPGVLAILLEELQALVEPHFAMEERPGGLYDDIRAAQPRLDSEVKKLERQHIEMLARLDELRAGYDRLESVANQLRSRAVELVEQLAAHEKTEARLTADAYYIDIGVGD